MKLYLIRHGKTEANERRLYCGSSDLPLSPKGREELESLAALRALPEAALYVASSLRRTSETMEIVCGRGPDVCMSEFSEMAFGDFELHSYEELKDKPQYRAWLEDMEGFRCPGGESRKQFRRRVLEGLRKLEERGCDSVLLVTHGGVIVELMESCFPGEKGFYDWQPPCGEGWMLDTAGMIYEKL